MKKDEQLIDKINKLLALSKSSNPHEAEIALRKANALMEEHSIKNIDLIPKSNVTHGDIESVTGQHYIWARVLAAGCAKLFDCKHINYPGDKGVRFIGADENIMCATQLFWHLFKAWKGMCATDYSNDKPSNRKLYRKSHGIGYATRVYERVSELTEERHKNILKSTGTDLVVVKDAKIQDYMDTTFNLRKSKSRELTLSSSGLLQGKEAGNKVQLVAPVGKTKAKAIE